MNRDIIKQILDRNNCDNVTLYDGDCPIEFEQVAVIPFDGRIYAILKPVDKMEGVADNEAIVFKLDVKDDMIVIIEDEYIIDKVFESYMELINEQNHH